MDGSKISDESFKIPDYFSMLIHLRFVITFRVNIILDVSTFFLPMFSEILSDFPLFLWTFLDFVGFLCVFMDFLDFFHLVHRPSRRIPSPVIEFSHRTPITMDEKPTCPSMHPTTFLHEFSSEMR